MKTYEISFARVEHNVYRFDIEAEDEEQAEELARDYMASDEFDWDDYETVHADEFINGIDEQGDDYER